MRGGYGRRGNLERKRTVIARRLRPPWQSGAKTHRHCEAAPAAVAIWSEGDCFAPESSQ